MFLKLLGNNKENLEWLIIKSFLPTVRKMQRHNWLWLFLDDYEIVSFLIRYRFHPFLTYYDFAYLIVQSSSFSVYVSKFLSQFCETNSQIIVLLYISRLLFAFYELLV